LPDDNIRKMTAKWHSAVTVPRKWQQFPDMSWFWSPDGRSSSSLSTFQASAQDRAFLTKFP